MLNKYKKRMQPRNDDCSLADFTYFKFCYDFERQRLSSGVEATLQYIYTLVVVFFQVYLGEAICKITGHILIPSYTSYCRLCGQHIHHKEGTSA